MSGNGSPLTIYCGGPARLTSDLPQFRHGIILTSWKNIINFLPQSDLPRINYSRKNKGAQLQFFLHRQTIYTPGNLIIVITLIICSGMSTNRKMSFR